MILRIYMVWAALCLPTWILSACSSTQTATSIAALESSLTAADDAALGYLQLPVCTGSNGPVCGNPTVRAQIKEAAATAYAAIKAAEAANAAGKPADVTAATAALMAFQAVITSATKGS